MSLRFLFLPLGVLVKLCYAIFWLLLLIGLPFALVTGQTGFNPAISFIAGIFLLAFLTIPVYVLFMGMIETQESDEEDVELSRIEEFYGRPVGRVDSEKKERTTGTSESDGS